MFVYVECMVCTFFGLNYAIHFAMLRLCDSLNVNEKKASAVDNRCAGKRDVGSEKREAMGLFD